MQNQIFELIENENGQASAATVMTFDASTHPYRATYTGPNIVFGHAIVTNNQMLYHALDTEGELNAGKATVHLTEDTMTLNWMWLTGSRTSGVSRWRRVRPGST